MTKFAALSILDLRTPEANRGRRARRAKFVVAVEADDGSWFELDADDRDHARTLARNVVDVQSARGASCWVAVPVGDETAEHGARSFFNYYDTGPKS
jgi:hypothetical protein